MLTRYTQVAVVVLLAAVPYNIDVRTGAGSLHGTVTVAPNASSWDLKLSDTNQADGACVFAKIVVDRSTPPSNVVRSTDACSDRPVPFTGKDPHGNHGLRVDFCSRKPNAAANCIRVPTRLLPLTPQG
jgi:hypothetical protein